MVDDKTTFEQAVDALTADRKKTTLTGPLLWVAEAPKQEKTM